jgi:hypothetical protein
MLVLLGISTLAAALIPTRPPGEGTTGSTATEETEAQAPDGLPEGESQEFVFRIEEDKIQVVKAEVGDQLSLTIRSKLADLIEIPALGRVEPIARGSPARFNILAQDPGSYGIRLVERDRVVARIEVAKRRPEREKDR